MAVARERAVGYVRVSTDEQAQQGLSLEAQRARIAAYCDAMRIDLVDVCADEGISGRSAIRRPGWQRALAMHRDGDVDKVIAVAVDRISRNGAEFASMLCRTDQRGSGQFADGGLVCIEQGFDASQPIGRLFANIMAQFAQYESEANSARTRQTMQHASRQGRVVGRPPYGWQSQRVGDTAVLAFEPGEIAVLRLMQAQRDYGRTYRELADELNELGHRTRSGGLWSHTAVRRILANYASRLQQNLPNTMAAPLKLAELRAELGCCGWCTEHPPREDSWFCSDGCEQSLRKLNTAPRRRKPLPGPRDT